jgi:hypothetical protein
MAHFSFDAAQVIPQQSFSEDPLPAGTYGAEISDVALQPARSGSGRVLKLEYTIKSPSEHARRKIWEYLNVEHSKAETQSMALGRLSSLCRALGIAGFKDTDELLGRSVSLRTRIKPGDNGYGPRAEITGYLLGPTAHTSTNAPGAVTAPTAPASLGIRPWERA